MSVKDGAACVACNTLAIVGDTQSTILSRLVWVMKCARGHVMVSSLLQMRSPDEASDIIWECPQCRGTADPLLRVSRPEPQMEQLPSLRLAASDPVITLGSDFVDEVELNLSRALVTGVTDSAKTVLIDVGQQTSREMGVVAIVDGVHTNATLRMREFGGKRSYTCKHHGPLCDLVPGIKLCHNREWLIPEDAVPCHINNSACIVEDVSTVRLSDIGGTLVLRRSADGARLELELDEAASGSSKALLVHYVVSVFGFEPATGAEISRLNISYKANLPPVLDCAVPPVPWQALPVSVEVQRCAALCDSVGVCHPLHPDGEGPSQCEVAPNSAIRRRVAQRSRGELTADGLFYPHYLLSTSNETVRHYDSGARAGPIIRHIAGATPQWVIRPTYTTFGECVASSIEFQVDGVVAEDLAARRAFRIKRYVTVDLEYDGVGLLTAERLPAPLPQASIDKAMDVIRHHEGSPGIYQVFVGLHAAMKSTGASEEALRLVQPRFDKGIANSRDVVVASLCSLNENIADPWLYGRYAASCNALREEVVRRVAETAVNRSVVIDVGCGNKPHFVSQMRGSSMLLCAAIDPALNPSVDDLVRYDAILVPLDDLVRIVKKATTGHSRFSKMVLCRCSLQQLVTAARLHSGIVYSSIHLLSLFSASYCLRELQWLIRQGALLDGLAFVYEDTEPVVIGNETIRFVSDGQRSTVMVMGEPKFEEPVVSQRNMLGMTCKRATAMFVHHQMSHDVSLTALLDRVDFISDR